MESRPLYKFEMSDCPQRAQTQAKLKFIIFVFEHDIIHLYPMLYLYSIQGLVNFSISEVHSMHNFVFILAISFVYKVR